MWQNQQQPGWAPANQNTPMRNWNMPTAQPAYNNPVYSNADYARISQQPVRNVLPGRVINDLNDVTPNEVPMDGSPGVFLQGDGSCVYVKAWKADGTIGTLKYMPCVETPTEKPETFNDIVLKRLDNIEKMLSKEVKSYGHQFDHSDSDSTESAGSQQSQSTGNA